MSCHVEIKGDTIVFIMHLYSQTVSQCCFWFLQNHFFSSFFVAVIDMRIMSRMDTAPLFRHSVHSHLHFRDGSLRSHFHLQFLLPDISGLERHLCFSKYHSRSCSLQPGLHWWEGIAISSGLWFDLIPLHMKLLHRVPSKPGNSCDLIPFLWLWIRSDLTPDIHCYFV